MQLKYSNFIFKISFNKLVKFNTDLVFILRSIIGSQLRKLCCCCEKSLCPGCLFKQSCVYANLFETILPKDNDVLINQNRGAHPFLLRAGEICDLKNRFDSYKFEIQLYGDYISNIKEIYMAILNGGKEGFGKTRTQYTVSSVTCAGKELLNGENLIPDFCIEEWNEKQFENSSMETGDILVVLKSPLRLKIDGKYLNDFTAVQFMNAIQRRRKTLYGLYGFLEEQSSVYEKTDFELCEKNFSYKEDVHYSARQKRSMKMGGIIGNFAMHGLFSQRDLMLLEFAKTFGLGKNTIFGLGNIDYWKKTTKMEK